jgi:hypothetical protein
MLRLALAITATVLLVGCGSEDLKGAPNVKGLVLPEPKVQLKKAGFAASVKTDALFGVLVESHYTVCREHSPNGKLVPIEVSKSC